MSNPKSLTKKVATRDPKMWIWPVKNFAILALHTTSLSGLIQILYFLICSYILIKEKIHDDFIIADDNIIDKLYYLKICSRIVICIYVIIILTIPVQYFFKKLVYFAEVLIIFIVHFCIIITMCWNRA